MNVKWSIPVFMLASGFVIQGAVSNFQRDADNSQVNLSQINASQINSVTRSRHEYPAVPARVMALGRLAPASEMTVIYPPTSSGTRVGRVCVSEGQWVRSGEVVAYMDTRALHEAELQEALADLDRSRCHLEQVRADAKPADLSAQAAVIERARSEMDTAKTEYGRYQMLYEQGAVSASLRDSKKQSFDTASQQWQQQQFLLQGMCQVRPCDENTALAEVKQAISRVQIARQKLALDKVTSPVSGKVIKIHTRAGEVVGNEGILQICDTRHLIVIAEVFESDIGTVRPGQGATITGASLGGPLHGVVESIGLSVGRQTNLDADSAADTEARIVEVRIRVRDGATATAANARVDVEIARSK
ncbi:MAG: HlyD family efflux transporter periplasmic adaptor subunit [Candidatus Obscuribacterales bacterium]